MNPQSGEAQVEQDSKVDERKWIVNEDRVIGWLQTLLCAVVDVDTAKNDGRINWGNEAVASIMVYSELQIPAKIIRTCKLELFPETCNGHQGSNTN